MTDNFDDQRRAMIDSGQPEVDAIHTLIRGEQTWTTAQMQEDFEPLSFAAPFIIVRRRADGVRGSLEFTHSPRVYFNWQPEDG
jgi:hypothetical protein